MEFVTTFYIIRLPIRSIQFNSVHNSRQLLIIVPLLPITPMKSFSRQDSKCAKNFNSLTVYLTNRSFIRSHLANEDVDS